MNDGRAIAFLQIAKVIKMLSNSTQLHCKFPGQYIFRGLLLADFDGMVYLCEA